MSGKKSIMQEDTQHCYLCGRNGYLDHLEKHHALHGTANRQLAEEDGLFIWICGFRCHREGRDSVHRNVLTDLYVEQQAQKAYEKTHTREEFISRYGKNYL